MKPYAITVMVLSALLMLLFLGAMGVLGYRMAKPLITEDVNSLTYELTKSDQLYLGLSEANTKQFSTLKEDEFKEKHAYYHRIALDDEKRFIRNRMFQAGGVSGLVAACVYRAPEYVGAHPFFRGLRLFRLRPGYCWHSVPDMKQNRSASGYTLVELGIALVIIGLLAAGVMTGVHLVAGAKIKRIIDEVQLYQQAVATFEQKYYEKPGDMSDAATHFGATAANGNGDGQIVWGSGPNEGAQAFLQLAKAGFLPDSGLSGVGANAVIGVNVPASGIGGAGYYFDSIAGFRNFLGFGGVQAAGANNRPVLPADSSYSIDTKFDDGFANSGRLLGLPNVTCATAANYNVSNPSALCTLRIRMSTE